MPELPEVESVRLGLADHVLNRPVREAEVFSERTARTTTGGSAALADQLTHVTLEAAVRRGKFLWLTLSSEYALLAHLGMSGQLLVRTDPLESQLVRHLRARLRFADDGVLDFVDQRTFGYLAVVPLVPTDDGGPGGWGSEEPVLPAPVAHIGRDLLDPLLDERRLTTVARTMRTRRTAVKRALLDQNLVSGVGNIYADEALWRAQVHPERSCSQLRQADAMRVLHSAREVMEEALEAGGTSFDALYVNVNGNSGYFDRRLAVYGQQGKPCSRCGTLIVREQFMNRGSHFCPMCQRNGAGSGKVGSSA